MFAITTGWEQAERYIEPYRDDVSIAAYNAPEVVTISGDEAALGEITKALKKGRVRFQELRTSHAFHSPLMRPVVESFKEEISRHSFKTSRTAIVANVSGAVARDKELVAPSYWADHLLSPVHFAQSIKTATKQKVKYFLEIGVQSTTMAEKPLVEQAITKQKTIPTMQPSNDDRPVIEQIVGMLVDFTHSISGLAADAIDPEANLFYLGLDSLTLVDLQNKVQDYYKIELNVQDLFEEYNTLRLMAEYIEANSAAVADDSPEDIKNYDSQIGENVTVDASGDSVMNVIQQQLALMNRQLEVLSGVGKIDKRTIEAVQSRSLQLATPSGQDRKRKPHRSHFDEFNPVRGMIFADEELTAKQRKFLGDFIKRYNSKTGKSKAYAEENRRWNADWISSLGYRQVIRDLVYPLVSAKSNGAYFTDVDGNEYIDIAMGYGVHFFGHQPRFVVDAVSSQLAEGFELGPQSDLVGENAKLLAELTGVERVAFTNTGTEAVMAAVRLARAVTGRDRIVIFSGSFHGTYDGILGLADGENTEPLSPGTGNLQISWDRRRGCYSPKRFKSCIRFSRLLYRETGVGTG